MSDDPRIKALLNVPVEYQAQIGNLIVSYAYMEKFAQKIVYLVSGIDAELGGLIVRAPRLTDVILMIEDVCDLKDIRIDLSLTKEIYKEAEKDKEFRDLIAHSNWINYKGSVSVLKSRGKWGKNRRDLKHRSKSIVHEARRINLERLIEHQIQFGNLQIQLFNLFEQLEATLQKK